jgi:hypothetical protein
MRLDATLGLTLLALTAVSAPGLADEPVACALHEDCPPGFTCLCDAVGRLLSAFGDSDGDGLVDTVTACAVDFDEITVRCRTELDANENGIAEVVVETARTGGPNHSTTRDFDRDEDGRIEAREVDSYSGWADFQTRYTWIFDSARDAVGCLIDDDHPREVDWTCVADPPCPPDALGYVPDPAALAVEPAPPAACQWRCRLIE